MDSRRSGRRPVQSPIIPFSKGGQCTNVNIALVCEVCHKDRGSLDLRDWFDGLVWKADPRAKFVHAFLKSLNSEDAAA
jgi:hypothetical protein